MCLTQKEVIEIILSCAKGKDQSVDELCDKVIKRIDGRYFFCADYTLENLIAGEITRGNLKFYQKAGRGRIIG